MGLDHLLRALHRSRDARLVEGLQHVIDRIHLERLNRIVIERRRENNLRHAQLAFNELLDHAKSVEPRHLHVEKNEVGLVLLDQCERFQAVLPLRDHFNFRKSAQQERKLVSCGPLVVNDHCADSHRISRTSIG